MNIEKIVRAIADGEIKLEYTVKESKFELNNGKLILSAEKTACEISFPKRNVITPDMQNEIIDFVRWLTPCGQVTPSPKIDVIGKAARELSKKIK